MKTEQNADQKMKMKDGYKYLVDSGVDWTFGWFKTKVGLGGIPSEKIFNSRVVLKSDLDKAIAEYKAKQ